MENFLEKVPVKEIPALLRSGNIIDAKTIAGLYAFLDYQSEIIKKQLSNMFLIIWFVPLRLTKGLFA